MANVTVEKVYQSRQQDLELTLLNSSESSLEKTVHSAEINRPGLAITGFFERFPSKRIQIIGETEMAYLNHLSKEELKYHQA